MSCGANALEYHGHVRYDVGTQFITYVEERKKKKVL